LTYPLQWVVKQFGLYPVTYAVVAVLIAGTAVVAYLLLRSLKDQDWPPAVLYLPLFWSPAFLMHFAYDTGSTDIVLVLLTLLALLVRKNPAQVALVCAGALLVHEIYVIALLPALLGTMYIENTNRYHWWSLPTSAISCIAVCIAGFLCVQIFGRWTGTEAGYFDELTAISPELSLPRPEGNGWFEVTSNVNDNLEYTKQLLSVPENWIYITLPALYIVTAVIIFFPRGADVGRKAVFLGAAFAPFTLILFGGDVYRWISFAGVGVLIMGLAVGGRGRYRSVIYNRPGVGLAVLLPWALLGPFGAAEWPSPFPALHFLLEKLH
jgi:hypothetical protein